MTDCINLKTRFGQTFRVTSDESYKAETGSTLNANRDPWLFLLRGIRGHICPWGGELLAVCLKTGHTGLAAKLWREPWVIRDRSQFGDDGEMNAVFHVDHFDEAEPYAKLYRKKVFSPEVLAKYRAQLLSAKVAKECRTNGGLERKVIQNATQ